MARAWRIWYTGRQAAQLRLAGGPHRMARKGQGRVAGSVPVSPALPDIIISSSRGMAPGPSQVAGKAGPLNALSDRSREVICMVRMA